MKGNVLFIFVLMLTSLFAQNKKDIKPVPVAPDCKNAKMISVDNAILYGPTIAPSGYGTIMEFKSTKKNDPYSFEQEHNSAWYCFNITKDCVLGLRIIPLNPDDDYDFLLFRYTDSTFCRDVAEKQILPVRSNISRTGKNGKYITGLSADAENYFSCAGPGKVFSKSIEVKKGEKYYLILDNVYSGGSGHTIEIGCEREINIAGSVLDDEQKPVQADVILEDEQGNELTKTKADKYGNYDINTYVIEKRSYNLIFMEDSSFYDIKDLNKKELDENNYHLTDIRAILPKLKKGNKYTLKSINFELATTNFLPSAYPSIRALVMLMKKNPNLRIRIEGHVDGYDAEDTALPEENKLLQELSEWRALVLKKYLISKGIKETRIETVGYGYQFMIYPRAKNEYESEQNRRVEIMVLQN